MNAIFTILVVLVVIASILLTIVVLLQNGKGDSMASNFVAGNQTFGVRQTANMLEKVTWGLVSFIVVVSIVSSSRWAAKTLRWTLPTRSRMLLQSSLNSLQLPSRVLLPYRQILQALQIQQNKDRDAV